MNKEVSFPIAKLLKEKGFDAYCDKKYIAQCLWQKPNSREKYKNSEIHKNSGDISAPTIADVVMWFYDKHRIWIWVGCRELEDGTNKTIFIPQGRTIPSTKKDGFVVDIIPYTPKGSPTEAYEAGIEYTLNHII